ncbi:putative membrane-bound metal-dependent hydrolase protein [Marine Group I thaumarchaeote SCGC AAA799-B03]|uniref:Putative membrane-bound metal-dependent hydrolase protein n=1 Tax=Marine Group I thaumarchaeote SCGC AAA799-B03 TaxID=1502289 RepID=A0A087S932_9ARCH|nr:putative membrane-bound metal-dependent hydrolase protein [Marine Group I thaumarchaeote SCGC AAA799-B03]
MWVNKRKNDLVFIIKATLLYGILAAGFSLLGIFLPERQFLDNPISGGLDWFHIIGHIVWGLMIGALSFSLRYFLLSGAFAIIIDWDHLVQFLDIDAIGRMGHSIPFGFLAAVVMMILFSDLRNRNEHYLLGAVAFAAMLAHISFDTLTGSGNFPLFAPFYDHLIRFPNSFWFVFQLAGAAIIISSMILAKSHISKDKDIVKKSRRS